MHKSFNHNFCCVGWPSAQHAGLAYLATWVRFSVTDYKSFFFEHIYHMNPDIRYDYTNLPLNVLDIFLVRATIIWDVLTFDFVLRQ